MASDTTLTGGGRYQGVGKFLQGSGAGDFIVCVVDVGHFGINGEEDKGDAHGVTVNDHREESEKLGDGTWETLGEECIREAAGTQSARFYIERYQATVAQWVALSLLFGVCAKESGYEGGGWSKNVRWRQETTEKLLLATLEYLR